MLETSDVRDLKPKRRGKYRNVKVRIGERVFDSKMEAARFVQLRRDQDDGLIFGLQVKPVYRLACGAKYIPDFEYRRKGTLTFSRHVVEDVKGFQTDVFRLKMRMMRREYGITVELVTLPSDVVSAWLALAKWEVV